MMAVLGDDLLHFNNLTVCLVFLVTFGLAYYFTRRDSSVPPGPPLWPVVGNLFSLLDKDTLNKLSTLRNQHGDVFSLYIGSEVWVFINGYDAIHDALIKHGRKFSDRPMSNFVKLLIGDAGLSIVMESGEAWKERRGFLLGVLRELCFTNNGKNVEEMVQKELKFFLVKLQSFDEATDPSDLLNLSFSNVISCIAFGHRFGYNHRALNKYLKELEEFVRILHLEAVFVNVFTFIPWMFSGIIRRFGDKRRKRFSQIFKEMGEETIKNYQEGKENCVLHHYMTLLRKDEYNGRKINTKHFNMDDAVWVLSGDLLGAGTETGASVAGWLFLHLALNSEIQRKARTEIDKHIPMDQLPSLSDRPRLPYIQALLLEGLRISRVAPLSVPRAVSNDTVFHGYRIPKNTPVLVNLSSVLMDPAIFPEPDRFRPERFLDDTGESIIQLPELIPFSLGLRSCPGESLARMEVFLYITAVLQRFEIKLPNNADLPSTAGVIGLTHHPQPYKVQFVPR